MVLSEHLAPIWQLQCASASMSLYEADACLQTLQIPRAGGTSGQPCSGQPGCNHEFAADLLIRSMCSFCSATCFPNLISSSLTCLFPVQRMHLFQHEKAVIPKSGADYTKADPMRHFRKHPLANQSTDSCPRGWGCLLPLCAQPDGGDIGTLLLGSSPAGDQTPGRAYTLLTPQILTADFHSLVASGHRHAVLGGGLLPGTSGYISPTRSGAQTSSSCLGKGRNHQAGFLRISVL